MDRVAAAGVPQPATTRAHRITTRNVERTRAVQLGRVTSAAGYDEARAGDMPLRAAANRYRAPQAHLCTRAAERQPPLLVREGRSRSSAAPRGAAGFAPVAGSLRNPLWLPL